TTIVQRHTDGDAYALFRIDAAGLKTLRVSGAGSGAYTLRLFAAGDANGDGQVDGRDFAVLDAARGSAVGDARYDVRADIDDDGRIDATDIQLVYANLGFAPNQAPSVHAFTGFTHVELEAAIAVSSFLADPEGDPLGMRIVSAEHGSARLSGDGSQVLFRPDPGFAGAAGFTVVADDGYSQSAAST